MRPARLPLSSLLFEPCCAVFAAIFSWNAISSLLKQDGVTPELQEKITDKMILVADRIADLHESNRNFLEGIIKYGTPLIGGALLLGAVILGVNVKGTKLPTITGKQ